MHTPIQASGNCRDARTGPLIAFLTHSNSRASNGRGKRRFLLLLPCTTTYTSASNNNSGRDFSSSPLEGREGGDRLVVRLRPRTPPSSRAVKVFTRRGSFP